MSFGPRFSSPPPGALLAANLWLPHRTLQLCMLLFALHALARLLFLFLFLLAQLKNSIPWQKKAEGTVGGGQERQCNPLPLAINLFLFERHFLIAFPHEMLQFYTLVRVCVCVDFHTCI